MREAAEVDTAGPDMPAERTSPKDSLKLGWIAWFTALYVPATLLIASRKLLWNDELFTYYIARRPGMAGIWSALSTGADQIPPLFYWITSACMSLPGDPRVLIRLPEMAGFWLMGVSMAAFVWQRLPGAYGLLPGLAALATGAYPYAYEARPYGLVLGFAALALLCWQRADRGRRFLWAAGLAASLAAAVSVHYYAVLVLVPIAGGEAVRCWNSRRPNWHVWCALAFAAGPLAVCLPLMRAARTYAGTFWARPGAASIGEFALFLFGAALVPFGALLVVAGALHFRRKGESAPSLPRIREAGFPACELTAILLFLLMPILALALAVTVTGAFTPRYALASVAGAGVFAAWLLAAAFRGRARPATAAACLLSVSFVLRAAHDFRLVTHKAAMRTGMIGFLSRSTTPALPVLIADPHLFFELSHEAPPELRRRLIYFAEPRLALHHLGTDTLDRCLTVMSRWAPLRLESLRDFLASGRTVLVFGYPAGYGEWVVQELISRQASISILGAYEGRLLLAAASAAAERPLSGPAVSPAYPGMRARR